MSVLQWKTTLKIVKIPFRLPLEGFFINGTVILPARQRQFFHKAVSYSWFLYSQIITKQNFFRGGGPCPSSTLILAEILLKSEFGDHPLVQEFYPPKTSKGANNLMLLELDEYWQGKFLKYEDKFYKSFKNWDEFGVHLTDCLVFRRNEIDKFTYHNLQTRGYNRDIKTIIDNYDLEDFESNGKTS